MNYRPEYQHGWGSKTLYTQMRLDAPPASPVLRQKLVRLGSAPSGIRGRRPLAGPETGAGILTPPTRARTHRIRDGSRESGQATRGGLRTFSGTEGQKTEDAGLRRLADVAVMQATDLGNLHDPARLGEFDRPNLRRILVERE